jgi:hypothetical protein
MMPQLLTVRVERPRRRPLRIWIPVVPVLLVFSPVLVLLALAATAACLWFRIRVLRTLRAGWRLVCALPGTRVAIGHGRVAVLVSVR